MMRVMLYGVLLGVIFLSLSKARPASSVGQSPEEEAEETSSMTDSKEEELEELLAIMQNTLTEGRRGSHTHIYHPRDPTRFHHPRNPTRFRRPGDPFPHPRDVKKQYNEQGESQGREDRGSNGSDEDDISEKKDEVQDEGDAKKDGDGEDSNHDGFSPEPVEAEEDDGNMGEDPAAMPKNKKEEDEEEDKEEDMDPYEVHRAAKDSIATMLSADDNGLSEIQGWTHINKLIRVLSKLSQVENTINRALKQICRRVN